MTWPSLLQVIGQDPHETYGTKGPKVRLHGRVCFGSHKDIGTVLGTKRWERKKFCRTSDMVKGSTRSPRRLIYDVLSASSCRRITIFFSFRRKSVMGCSGEWRLKMQRVAGRSRHSVLSIPGSLADPVILWNDFQNWHRELVTSWLELGLLTAKSVSPDPR